MARGISDVAYKARRTRFLRKAYTAAERAGLEAVREHGQLRVIDTNLRRSYLLRMDCGRMSNGESVLINSVTVRAVVDGSIHEHTYANMTWLAAHAVSKPFWDALKRGEWRGHALPVQSDAS